MRRKILSLLPWVILALWLGQAYGCARGMNEITPSSYEVSDDASYSEPIKISGASRDDWPEYQFYPQCLGVRHTPTYATPIRLIKNSTRVRGEYPTEDSVLQTSTRKDRGLQVLEVPVAATVMAFDVAAFPVHYVLSPSWKVQVSPQLPYERYSGEFASKASEKMMEENEAVPDSASDTDSPVTEEDADVDEPVSEEAAEINNASETSEDDGSGK